jgi:hypothetical protein
LYAGNVVNEKRFFFYVEDQCVIGKCEKYLEGNVGNKKCFHSFAADLTKGKIKWK